MRPPQTVLSPAQRVWALIVAVSLVTGVAALLFYRGWWSIGVATLLGLPLGYDTVLIEKKLGGHGFRSAFWSALLLALVCLLAVIGGELIQLTQIRLGFDSSSR